MMQKQRYCPVRNVTPRDHGMMPDTAFPVERLPHGNERYETPQMADGMSPIVNGPSRLDRSTRSNMYVKGKRNKTLA